MSAEQWLHLADIFAWPIVVLVCFLLSRKALIDFLSKFGHVEISSSAIKVTLKTLEQEYNVPKTQIRKLEGLTGHDLWALDSFIKSAQDDSFTLVDRLSPTRKAMAYSFIEMGLLEIVGTGPDRRLQPTKLAADVREAAGKLL